MVATRVPAINFIDGYKADHRRQYPINTVKVYSGFTPRKSRDKKVSAVVFFGLTYLIKDVIIREFNETFFSLPKEQAIAQYSRRIKHYLIGTDMDFEHIGALHDLGYLPVRIKALPEGDRVKIGVPVLTITNELPEFYWLPNYLESIISTELWPMTTSATMIHKYRVIFDKYAMLTTGSTAFSSTNQIHDFSMRGMFGRVAGWMSALAHLLGSRGTDNVGAIDFAEIFYNADCEKENIATSVAATEHAVMCMGTKEAEIDTFRRLLALYPTGILSVVSDTWDLWKVLTQYLVELKPTIMERAGKLVIRPDSGNPIDILCGHVFEEFKTVEEAREFYKDDVWREASDACGKKTRGAPAYERKFKVGGKYYSALYVLTYVKGSQGYWEVETCASEPSLEIERTPAEIGVVELLWNTFGGTVNELGFKELDPHIGCIYGDSITPERAEQICQRLMDKGFASTNWVAGVGSFTYTYTTRDTYGFAMKAVYGELEWPMINIRVNDKNQLVGECPQIGPGDFVICEGTDEVQKHKDKDYNSMGICMIETREIYKDPITDDGTKKSAKGQMVVWKDENEDYFMEDGVDDATEEQGELITVYANGQLLVDPTLEECRERFERGVKNAIKNNN